ncbi:hypothetical protein [Candidatus Entotheonella palauensis]|uniref:Uncharacterized protein n=1 Tax=Candidatus Entotheonella gemina TaxID=1429439 RepID=W4LCE1_9BACT|nr:hypothetical protein [Candidatus Entotheonella palauensis]ETW95657.1 MAG: hypothetical protein ETSY2_47840 [Candidatus Entotheonella gemina]
MLKSWIGMALAVLALGGLQLAWAQKSTEIYIPIGKSPGLSETRTIIGSVVSVSAPEQRFTVAEGQTNYTVQVDSETRIWLDQSALNTANRNGSFDALQPERRVEVKYKESERQAQVTAEWIKVEMRQ